MESQSSPALRFSVLLFLYKMFVVEALTPVLASLGPLPSYWRVVGTCWGRGQVAEWMGIWMLAALTASHSSRAVCCWPCPARALSLQPLQFPMSPPSPLKRGGLKRKPLERQNSFIRYRTSSASPGSETSHPLQGLLFNRSMHSIHFSCPTPAVFWISVPMKETRFGLWFSFSP